MSHFLGRVVPDGRTLNQTAGLDLIPGPGPFGGPRFVILHFDNVNLQGNARLTVDLGYGTDVFTTASGASFWSRPVDTSLSPIPIRITGGNGSARLREYGSGEPSTPPGHSPGTPFGSRTNPDPFLQTDPYQEPIYETRLECNSGFAWRNAACALPSIATAVKDRVAAAVGIIVEVHDGHVSSCSGTLIAADLFLTARHCLTDPTGEDLRSASVTFDYVTACGGGRPPGHVTRFFKVLGEVASGSPADGRVPPVATDWVILRLDAAPGALPPPLQMRNSALMLNEIIFTMHHPNGAVKKTQAGTFRGGSITGFDYAGGSSGSALFDVNGLLVGGPLSAGSGCSVSYAPIAPIRSALTNPPVPPAPIDVMVVFDRSGSMSSAAPPVGRTKLEEAQDAAALFIRLLRQGQGDRAGLVTFSSSATLETAPDLVENVRGALIGLAPFTGGQIGGITPGGTTSLGGGVSAAVTALGGPSANGKAILLLTDGLQNTPPMIEAVEGSLGAMKLCAIGFGSDAEINGPLLSRIAREHGGDFTRAVDGLALRKFFGLCFGNIFETGALVDPDHLLKAREGQSAAHKFPVCGEERITIVIGWDDPATPLKARILTPSGAVINEKLTETARGRTWVFWRIPLPHNGERDGTWQFTVDRVAGGGEFPPPPTDVRYFFLVVCAGGPKLRQLNGPRRVYTGDRIDPKLGLHYPNGTTPKAQVLLTVEIPSVALGQLVMSAGLRAPRTTGDSVNSYFATLQDISREPGGILPVNPTTVQIPLFDDGMHEDGAMEPDGIYNQPLEDLTRVEGTYHFRAVATYGETCQARREVSWSVHVEPAIDPERTQVAVTNLTNKPTGQQGTFVIIPRDKYGNPLGPGRSDVFSVSPAAGVSGLGEIVDRGDGSYEVEVAWPGPAAPGLILQQPDRRPIQLAPPFMNGKTKGCEGAAGKLLECIGLVDPKVKGVKVKKVTLDIDLACSTDRKECECGGDEFHPPKCPH